MGRRQKQQRNRRREEIGGKAETAGKRRAADGSSGLCLSTELPSAARRKKDAADKQCQQYELNIIPL